MPSFANLDLESHDATYRYHVRWIAQYINKNPHIVEEQTAPHYGNILFMIQTAIMLAKQVYKVDNDEEAAARCTADLLAEKAA